MQTTPEPTSEPTTPEPTTPEPTTPEPTTPQPTASVHGYFVGSYGTQCDDAGMLDLAECREAAQILRKNFYYTANWDFMQRNCGDNYGNVIFNEHSTGSASTSHRPICKVS